MKPDRLQQIIALADRPDADEKTLALRELLDERATWQGERAVLFAERAKHADRIIRQEGATGNSDVLETARNTKADAARKWAASVQELRMLHGHTRRGR